MIVYGQSIKLNFFRTIKNNAVIYISGLIRQKHFTKIKNTQMQHTPISKNTLKIFSSLQKKKYRDKENLFIVEGKKMVQEAIINTPDTIKALLSSSAVDVDLPRSMTPKYFSTTPDEIKKISSLTTPPAILAVMEKQPAKHLKPANIDDLTIALDTISDPGNLGTIIRLADWFGVKHIVCSKQSVDLYNPKVIQATMGSIFRVAVTYTDLDIFIRECLNDKIPVYGTSLSGKNIYGYNIQNPSVLILGNESLGLSESLQNTATENLLIPSFSKNDQTSESLNVSTATAIALSEIRRQQHYSK